MIPPKVLSGSEKWPYAAHRAGERITNKKQWFNFGVVILWEILRTKLWANFDNFRNMTVNVLFEQKSKPRLGFNLVVTFLDVGTRSMCTPVLKICFGPPTAESKNLKNHVNFGVGDLFFRSPALWSSQNVFGPPTAGRVVVDSKDRALVQRTRYMTKFIYTGCLLWFIVFMVYGV